MIPISTNVNSMSSNAMSNYPLPPQHDQHGASSSNQLQHSTVLKRPVMYQGDESGARPSQDEGAHGLEELQVPRKKGRKKSFIWTHTVVDESGKVHCKHCNSRVSVKYGEKVERLRRHFLKHCSKSPFQKDSKEYEELMEAETASANELRKKGTFLVVTGNKTRGNNRIVVSQSIGFVASMLTSATMALSAEQIAKLEAQGNRSSNWAGIKLTGIPNAYDVSLERIRNCFFSGTIYIGVFLKNVTMEHNISTPSGLYNSNFHGTCMFLDNCYVYNCSTVSNVFLGRNSSLVNCGIVMCEGSSSYGTQRVIAVGSEGKNASKLNLTITSSYPEICANIILGKKYEQEDKRAKSNRNDEFIRFDMSVICDEVEVRQCSKVRNAFIGSYSKIISSEIDSCTFLSYCNVFHSIATECVLHISASIEEHCICNGLLMFSHSHVSKGAKVEECVLGPDSSVSVGECKRSLVGPFVGFHHQSLLISSFWPLGRGNIAYGSMIGANHTGRTNDQECLPGEGCFFGLATTVKFPFNLQQSPYTMIASNTQCNPQKICFPFSLLSNHDGPDKGWAKNLLRPAWIIWSNPYFIERGVMKFSSRRKSSEYRTDFPIYRPAMVDLVVDARSRLLKFKAYMAHQEQQPDAVLSVDEQCLPGIGKCLLIAGDVDRAIEAYTMFIRRYALHGFIFLIATADSCKSDPDNFSSYTVNNRIESDSEEENNMLGAPPSHHLSAAANALTSLPNAQNYGSPSSFSPHIASIPPPIPLNASQQALLEDLKGLDNPIPCTIEEYLLRKTQFTDMQALGNKRVIMEIAANGYGNLLIMSLMARSGACSIVSDSHDYAVRCHQLRVLQDEFPQLDFISFLESVPKTGKLAAHMWSREVLETLCGLLQMIVEMERKLVENIRSGRRKDLQRAGEVIKGGSSNDVLHSEVEEDEVVQKAVVRCDDISLFVHRVISQLRG